jgi:cytochrome b pre-mRNA-processing protein 3
MLKVLAPLTEAVSGALCGALSGLFRTRPQTLIGRGLYGECVRQSRQVVFYTQYGVRDEIGARFELLCLHVVVLVTTLRGQGDEIAQETAQGLFDGFMQGLDDTLREQGVGDVSVPKKMKKIITDVYTRLKTWDEMWKAGADAATQTTYIRDTIFAVSDDDAPIAQLDVRADAMFVYLTQMRTQLKASALITGQVDWPAIAALAMAESESVTEIAE